MISKLLRQKVIRSFSHFVKQKSIIPGKKTLNCSLLSDFSTEVLRNQKNDFQTLMIAPTNYTLFILSQIVETCEKTPLKLNMIKLKWCLLRISFTITWMNLNLLLLYVYKYICDIFKLMKTYKHTQVEKTHGRHKHTHLHARSLHQGLILKI